MSGQRVVAIIGAAVQALELIAAATKGLLASEPTTEQILAVLHGIDAAARTVQEGFDGVVTPDVVEKSIRDLGDALAKNNSAAQAALDAKFPK